MPDVSRMPVGHPMRVAWEGYQKTKERGVLTKTELAVRVVNLFLW